MDLVVISYWQSPVVFFKHLRQWLAPLDASLVQFYEVYLAPGHWRIIPKMALASLVLSNRKWVFP